MSRVDLRRPPARPVMAHPWQDFVLTHERSNEWECKLCGARFSRVKNKPGGIRRHIESHFFQKGVTMPQRPMTDKERNALQQAVAAFRRDYRATQRRALERFPPSVQIHVLSALQAAIREMAEEDA